MKKKHKLKEWNSLYGCLVTACGKYTNENVVPRWKHVTCKRCLVRRAK